MGSYMTIQFVGSPTKTSYQDVAIQITENVLYIESIGAASKCIGMNGASTVLEPDVKIIIPLHRIDTIVIHKGKAA